MTIAFQIMGGPDWTAGSIYLHNLFHALKMIGQEEIRLVVPNLKNPATEGHPGFPEIGTILPYGPPRRWTPQWTLNEVFKRLLGTDHATERHLARNGVHVVFGPLLRYRYGSIASLSWLPDFQHVKMPKMFSKEELLARDREFLRTAEISTRIVLLSESVRHDFQAFAPEYAHKARVLRPVTHIPSAVYQADPTSIADRYGLPRKFIYLPNQFWKHKNHKAVFRSLRTLKDQGTEVIVVCSGNPIDYRDPGYFSQLLQMLSCLGIRNQVIILGLLPRAHVFALIRQSICVLNPSLFEGFGLSVDEARSLGKLCLLSDIPAHREQNPPRALFFNPEDRKDLANKMEGIWRSEPPGPNPKSEAEARDDLMPRLRGLGESFISVVNEVVQKE